MTRTGRPNEPLRRAMAAANYSEERLAEAVGYHPKQVGRWVAEGVVPRRVGIKERVAVVLGVEPQEIWPPEPPHGGSWAPPTASYPGTFEEVDRRSLVRTLGGSFAGAVVAPSAAFATSKDVSPDLPGYYAHELAKHYATDVRLGARPLLETVTAQHLLVCRAAQVAPTSLRGDLLGVAVAYAAFAGWLYLDLGDLHRAWQWRSEALELAHRTGDRNLVSYALANLATVRVDAGDGHGGAELARAALADTTLCRKARRYALREAAHAFALTGDRDGADRALDQGADLLTTGDDDTYPWGTAWQASPSYVEAQRATCYGRTGHASEAAGLWEHVLAHHPSDARRDQGVYLVRYAGDLLDSEGPSAALAPAATGVECLRHTSSARMQRELVQLRNTVAHRRDTTAGRDLYDLLRQVA